MLSEVNKVRKLKFAKLKISNRLFLMKTSAQIIDTLIPSKYIQYLLL